MARKSSAATKPRSASGYGGTGPIGLVALVRQGLDEFLAFPLVVVLAFIGLAAVTLWMDASDLAPIRAGHRMLSRFVFVTESGTASVLGQLLSGLLTVISITFSVLLLAVQQTATTLSNQVYSQFLRRRINQLYFGFFLGLAVYDVAALSAAHPHFNPVYTASFAVLLTTAGLCLLIILIYSTVDQMRPSVIVRSLRDHSLAARQRARALLSRTRRTPRCGAPVQATIHADDDGFLQDVRLDELARLLGALGPDAELEVLHPIGTFVAYDDRLALIRAHDRDAAAKVADDVRGALALRPERDLKRDAGFGILQLESIAWTTASSAKSTPDAPRLVIYALRDLLGRWMAERGGETQGAAHSQVAVAIPDRIHDDALDALVTIGLASDESKQHVVITAAFDALGQLLPRATGELRERLLDGLRTLVPALSALPLTPPLHDALSRVARGLDESDQGPLAAELRKAAAVMQSRKGRLRPG